MKKIGRNDPCPCGKGKKYKHCCEPNGEVDRAKTQSSDLSISQVIQVAREHHQAGRLSQAEAIYQQILQIVPNHPDALHLSGLIALRRGKSEIAVGLISRAISVNPSNPAYYINLGNAFKDQGRLQEAILNYQQAVSIKPDFAEACTNLGNALKEQGNLEAAVENFRRSLALKPNFAETHSNLGNALKDQGLLEEAIACYSQALQLRPDYAEAYNNLGAALKAQNKLNEAIESYRKAVSLKSDFFDAHNNLGNALMAQGNLEAAVMSFYQSLLIKPDFAEAHNNLGNALKDQGKLDAAIGSFQRALEIKSDFAEAHSNLGLTLHKQSKMDEAIAHYYKALSIKPDYAEAYNNLGLALQEQGKLDEAVDSYHRALALRPFYSKAHSNLLFSLSFYSKCSPDTYLAEARDYGNKVMRSVQPYTSWSVYPANSAEKSVQTLRIGLVSGDFKAHPVGFFLEGILANLNPDRVELVAYSVSPLEDELTARIRPCFVAWNLIVGLSDEAAAQKIHDDGIHILVDLAGHTASNRLPMFALKPAPVQVSWLGYFATTGLPGIDYLLADPVSVPESHQEHFTETVWYLPETRLCFTPPANSTELGLTPLPAVQNGYITFGCFQNLTKVNNAVLAAWGQIFLALPEARLWLQSSQMNCSTAREYLQRRLAHVGIMPERVIMEGHVPRADYLATYANVDIILDTFPYPGGTTTCEAMWMGVPTLTLAGDTLLARQGASMLACVGLEDWIVGDESDYVTRSLLHATDINGLVQLRSVLRQKALASPLFNASRFALHLEDALQRMWQQKMYLDSDH
ncbi:tetratricopeptide repeat protein [Candidatus Nitrotoga sp. M5]|uniref:tetratricopeptide repeat protein n=1 Tax=Candidatus Nitrotoga sp. M5 TaxID=2890409 RepID=UPI001EF17E9B|nr:glycosyltransferase family 41 protein [Candidatus Nitrotoga sp. M5]CAH1385681.1 Protein O-GlcNAc transferase [Candidatus Nitrotoga sp. M5]